MSPREYERYLLNLLFETAINQNYEYQPKDLNEYFVFKAAAALLDGKCKLAGKVWWHIVDNSLIKENGFKAIIPFGKILSLLPISLQKRIPAF